MTIEIGQVEGIFRYPIKSMAGVRVEAADLGWRGIDGDRRLALRRCRERGGFPWLTAGTLSDLVRFHPVDGERTGADTPLPTHVRTPDGRTLAVFGDELAAELGHRHGSPVEMMHLRDGVFDEATVSVIAADTVRDISTAARQSPDVRRFRPNIVVRLVRPGAFAEDDWLGGVLLFGEDDEGPRLSVTTRDARCAMINIDPDTGRAAPEMMKSIVRINQNHAGVYGTVIRPGRLTVGQTIRLRR